MTGIVRPQFAQLARPIPPTAPAPPVAPAPRAMDAYPPDAAGAFSRKENAHFGKDARKPDDVISILSPHGWFKIVTYPNGGNQSDIHYAVFFHNKVTGQTFEVHGTIARFYIDLVRNGTSVDNFPISDTRAYRANSKDAISYFSRYSLHWEQATNNVIKRFYTPYDPALATNAARLHDHDPRRKSTLVAYSEEYYVPPELVDFSNWKDERDLGKYARYVWVRNSGMPSQILLHETAGFSNMSIPNASRDKKGTYLIPHFCVNNLSAAGKGNVIQFVDVAVKVAHGEVVNDRSVGIEFVNSPVEAYKRDEGGNILEPKVRAFELDSSKRGIYLQTKLKANPQLFIPLQFSAKADPGYFELTIPKEKLLNFVALDAGIGANNDKVVSVVDGDAVIKYARAAMFEHLATLVAELVHNGLIKGVSDLSDESLWKPVISVSDKLYYIFQNAWTRANDGTQHHFTEIREPGFFTHQLIGSHGDGGLQGLYLFLKFVFSMTEASIIQVMIDCLTSEKTAVEASGLTLLSKVIATDDGIHRDPPKPISLKIGNLLEIDRHTIASQLE